MSIDKLCDERGVLVNLLPAHAKLVQLLEEGSPGRVNVLGLLLCCLFGSHFLNGNSTWVRNHSRAYSKHVFFGPGKSQNSSLTYVKAYVWIPANMAHMPKVGGEADTGLVKLAIVHWDLIAALSSSRLARFCQCTCRRDGLDWKKKNKSILIFEFPFFLRGEDRHLLDHNDLHGRNPALPYTFP